MAVDTRLRALSWLLKQAWVRFTTHTFFLGSRHFILKYYANRFLTPGCVQFPFPAACSFLLVRLLLSLMGTAIGLMAHQGWALPHQIAPSTLDFPQVRKPRGGCSKQNQSSQSIYTLKKCPLKFSSCSQGEYRNRNLAMLCRQSRSPDSSKFRQLLFSAHFHSQNVRPLCLL